MYVFSPYFLSFLTNDIFSHESLLQAPYFQPKNDNTSEIFSHELIINCRALEKMLSRTFVLSTQKSNLLAREIEKHKSFDGDSDN